MRALLLPLYGSERPEAGSAHEREWLCGQQQALAIARHMRDGGNMAPLVACRAASPLGQELATDKLPAYHIDNDNFFTALGLCWQYRKHKKLLVLTIGQYALALATRIRKLRALTGYKTLCVHAFFVGAPDATAATGRHLRQARHIIHGSEYLRLQLATALGRADENPAVAALPQSELTLLAPGVSWPSGTMAAPYREGHFIIGMGAALGARSGVRCVLKALARLQTADNADELPPMELRLVGHGPRFDEILQEATTLGLHRRLAILGEQSMADVLPHCHAWLAPGSAPDEAPETLACALAAGLPVIAANGLLHRERLVPRHGTTQPALLVQENDTEAWANALRRVLLDADLRQRLATEGHGLWPELSIEHTTRTLCSHLEQWFSNHDWQEAGQ